MKIVTTGTFVYRGRTYAPDSVLELPDAVAAEAIDDGVADPVEEAAPATDPVPPDAIPVDPDPAPADAAPARAEASEVPARASARKTTGAGS